MKNVFLSRINLYFVNGKLNLWLFFSTLLFFCFTFKLLRSTSIEIVSWKLCRCVDPRINVEYNRRMSEIKFYIYSNSSHWTPSNREPFLLNFNGSVLTESRSRECKRMGKKIYQMNGMNEQAMIKRKNEQTSKQAYDCVKWQMPTIKYIAQIKTTKYKRRKRKIKMNIIRTEVAVWMANGAIVYNVISAQISRPFFFLHRNDV